MHVEDTVHCDAHLVVFWMRARSFLWVMLLFCTLTNIVLTTIVRLHVVEQTIMDAAVRADAGSEFPIYATVARSFLMQEHRVELRMREALIQEEMKVLQEEQLRCQAEARAFEEKLA